MFFTNYFGKTTRYQRQRPHSSKSANELNKTNCASWAIGTADRAARLPNGNSLRESGSTCNHRYKLLVTNI